MKVEFIDSYKEDIYKLFKIAILVQFWVYHSFEEVTQYKQCEEYYYINFITSVDYDKT